MLGVIKNAIKRVFNKQNRSEDNPDYSKKLRFFHFKNFKDHKIFIEAINLSLSDDKEALERVRSVLPNFQPRPIAKVLSETGVDFGVDDIFIYDIISKLGNSCNIIEWDGHYQMYLVGGAKRSGDIMLRFAIYIGQDQQLHAYIPQVGNSYDVINKRAFKESEKLSDVMPNLEALVERLIKTSRTGSASVSSVISAQLGSIRGSNGFEWSDDAVLGDLPGSLKSNLLVDYISLDIDIRQAFHLPHDVKLICFHPEYKCDFSKSNCVQLIAGWAVAEEDRLRNKCTIYDIRSMQDEKCWNKSDNLGSFGLFNHKGVWLYRQTFTISSTDFNAIAEIITDHKGCDLKCFSVMVKHRTSIGEDKYAFENITGESNEYTEGKSIPNQIHSEARS